MAIRALITILDLNVLLINLWNARVFGCSLPNILLLLTEITSLMFIKGKSTKRMALLAVPG